ncbi:MAG: hypothetical protein ACFFCM_20335 [Promethearchaeota archaeon]
MNDIEMISFNNFKFREKVKGHLEDVINLFESMKDQKEVILLKSLEILDGFISRSEKNNTSIAEDIDPRLLASTIIYTTIISNEGIQIVSMAKISEIANVNASTLGMYYRKYFKNFYAKTKFFLSEYKLGRIRNNIALYFFEVLKIRNIESYELVLCLKENIQRREYLLINLTQKDINTLYEIQTKFKNKFKKYFSDLVEIVKSLIYSSITHKKIGALLSLNSLVEYLREKNINLLQKGKLYNSIKEILDYLEEKNPNFFPKRWGDRERLPEKEKIKRDREYRRIVGRKLKFYLLKNIYSGRYYSKGIVKCPECVKDGLKNNTNSLRLKTLDCHHNSTEKENIFKSDNLFLLFNENRGKPHILEGLVNLLESENIILLCKNHHRNMHFNDEFDYIVNFQKIFSYPSELIHLIIKVSLESFRLTKNLTPNEKAYKKKNIIRKIKKRYIIERFYGDYCYICGEFSTKKDLSAFEFHHKYENPDNIKAHELFDIHSCSEIVEILKNEIGGYICSNCHTVIQYKLIHLLEDIYENKFIENKIIEDYKNAQYKFTTMDKIKGVVIYDILEKKVKINETFDRYLTAIYEISNFKSDVTISDLIEYTGFDQSTIHRFFYKNSDLVRQSIEIKVRGAPKPTIFSLTEKGREYLSLIYHFKNYYSNI